MSTKPPALPPHQPRLHKRQALFLKGVLCASVSIFLKTCQAEAPGDGAPRVSRANLPRHGHVGSKCSGLPGPSPSESLNHFPLSRATQVAPLFSKPCKVLQGSNEGLQPCLRLGPCWEEVARAECGVSAWTKLDALCPDQQASRSPSITPGKVRAWGRETLRSLSGMRDEQQDKGLLGVSGKELEGD